jgi:hypothetical protein
MSNRAGQSIQPDHHQGLSGSDFTQQLRQHRATAIGAGGVFLQHVRTTGGAQLVNLWVGALFIGRDARVADQSSPAAPVRFACRQCCFT